ATLVASDHHTANDERSAEGLCRPGDVARSQAGADIRRGPDLRPTVQGYADRAEPELRTAGSQGGDVSRGLRAVTEVRADHDDGGMQAPGQHPARELLRAPRGDLAVEGEGQHV